MAALTGEQTAMTPHVIVWGEHRQDRADPVVMRVYPQGIHGAIAGPLRAAGLRVETATLDEPEHGLPEQRLTAARSGGGGTCRWSRCGDGGAIGKIKYSHLL